MPKVGIIISSTRPNRFADHPARWIFERASKRNSFEVEMLDLRDYPMPFFEEVASPAWAGQSLDGLSVPLQFCRTDTDYRDRFLSAGFLSSF